MERSCIFVLVLVLFSFFSLAPFEISQTLVHMLQICVFSVLKFA